VTDAGDAVPVDGLDPRAATLYPMVETALQVALDAAPRLGETVWSLAWARSASWWRRCWPGPGR
jgi:hypothetical protein